MSKSTIIVDNINLKKCLFKRPIGLHVAKDAELMHLRTKGPILGDIISKEADAAVTGYVAPQIKKLEPVPKEFKDKFAKIKKSRKYSEMQSLITETDSIPLLEYIQENIHTNGHHGTSAEELTTRAKFKIKLLKSPVYRPQFIEDRARFYEFMDKTLADAVKDGKITQKKASEMANYYRDIADEKIMYSILSHDDKFVFPNKFDETNSAVLELRLMLIKGLKN